jgi:hypothetical protein
MYSSALLQSYNGYKPPVPPAIPTHIELTFTVSSNNLTVENALIMTPIDGRAPAQVTIDWGDGNAGTYATTPGVSPLLINHTYAASGEYTITIDGIDENLFSLGTCWRNDANTQTITQTPRVLTAINAYRSGCIRSLRWSFAYATNLTVIETPFGAQDLPLCADYQYAFANATALNAPLHEDFLKYVPAYKADSIRYDNACANWSAWDQPWPVGMLSEYADDTVTLVLNYLFQNAALFNQALDENFLVAACEHVEYANSMLDGWSSFNQPIPPAVLKNFPICEQVVSMCRDWSAFNQPLEIVSSAPLLTSASYCCAGMTSFNSVVGDGFFADCPLLENVSGLCMNWTVYNLPLTAPFWSKGADIYTNVAQMCEGWGMFNQTPPAGFGNYPLAFRWYYTFADWFSMDSLLNDDFMSDCSGAEDMGSALQNWTRMTKRMPAQMLTRFKTGETSPQGSLQGIMFNWNSYNHDLHEGFFGGIGYYGNKAAMFDGWELFNSQINATLGTVQSWGVGTLNLSGCFSEWTAMTQPVPEGFLEGFTSCANYTSVMEKWINWAGAVPVLAVGEQEQQPVMQRAFEDNALMTGQATAIIGQRSWDPSVPAGVSGYYVLDFAFDGCTSLSDYSTIDSFWKNGYQG